MHVTAAMQRASESMLLLLLHARGARQVNNLRKAILSTCNVCAVNSQADRCQLCSCCLMLGTPQITDRSRAASTVETAEMIVRDTTGVGIQHIDKDTERPRQ
jgi:hypothetical protein